MIRPSPTRSLRLIRMSTTATSPPSPGPIFFGPHEVTSQVFLQTPLSFALVNIKPLLPGHVLVCPRRPHARLTDLAPADLADLFGAVQRVQRMLARHYFAGGGVADGAFNIAVQDGPEAGQTVGHLHVHVLPRVRGPTTAKAGPGPRGDRIYEEMAAEEGNVGGALWDREALRGGRPRPGGAFPEIEDAKRKARGMEEMEAEAAVFRRVLEDMQGGEGGGLGR